MLSSRRGFENLAMRLGKVDIPGNGGYLFTQVIGPSMNVKRYQPWQSMYKYNIMNVKR